jgi:hypothetical protein
MVPVFEAIQQAKIRTFVSITSLDNNLIIIDNTLIDTLTC